MEQELADAGAYVPDMCTHQMAALIRVK